MRDKTTIHRPNLWFLGHAKDNLDKLVAMTGPDEWGEYPLGEELGELIEDTARLLAGITLGGEEVWQ